MDKLFDVIPRTEGERIVLERLCSRDIPALEELVSDGEVYRCLPSFLAERQGGDMQQLIGRLYGECILKKETLILGIFEKPERRFCGLAELYGYKEEQYSVCIGYRLSRDCWGKGIATETVRLIAEHLRAHTDIRYLNASCMTDNSASARVLEKCGFVRTERAVREDWGLAEPVYADKWQLSV